MTQTTECEKIVLFKERINNIVAHTCFNNKSYFGFKSNVLKSGICKYIRRSEKEKFKWCVVEMLLFNFNKKGYALITNLINRLKILIMEELAVNEITAIILGIKKLDLFDKDRDNNMNKILEFCDIVIKCKKTRSVSYINWWWKTHPIEYNIDEIIINKVKKYEKKGDNEELLKLGELLIGFIENYDEKLFDIYNKMILIQNAGNRYRRKDGVYLFMQIIENYYCTNQYYKIIFDFALNMFHRKNMKERYYFGIWIGMLMLNKKVTDSIDIQTKIHQVNTIINTNELCEYFINRQQIIIDDYVINDYHVNKKYTLEKFSKVGAWVKHEDMTFLGEEKFLKYKNNYIKYKQITNSKKKLPKQPQKQEKQPQKQQKNTNEREKHRIEKYKKIKKIRGKPDFNDLEKDLDFIKDIDEKKIILCSNLTCGNKVMCFEYEGKIWKEGRKSMNYNRDYCVLDECKQLFDLEKIGMKRVLTNFRIEKIDKGKKNWNNNWQKVEIKEGQEHVVYCVMNKIRPGEEIGKHKNQLLENKVLFKEFVKIGVFRGIFRVSDFNKRNVLLKYNNKLVSIDEGDIGKRLDILGRKEQWLIKQLNKDKTIINEIIQEITNIDINKVFDIMMKYKFNNQLSNIVYNNWIMLKHDLIKEGIHF